MFPLRWWPEERLGSRHGSCGTGPRLDGVSHGKSAAVEAIEDRGGERTLWREDTLIGSFNGTILKSKSQFGEL